MFGTMELSITVLGCAYLTSTVAFTLPNGQIDFNKNITLSDTLRSYGTCNNNTACKNGGECKMDGSLHICDCPKGTGGPFCGIVPSCNDMECDNGASCVYDPALEEGNCKYNYPKLPIVSLVFRYREKCYINEDCKNGGQCQKSYLVSFCNCPRGTEGSFCETVSSCNGKECGTEASCLYDSALEEGICKCIDPEMSFEPNGLKCKKTCKDNAACKNGGKCKKNGSLDICACPKGTAGPFCETVESCDDVECGTEATCVYNQALEKGNCKCIDPEMSFDTKDLECKRTCKDNTACKNGGRCKMDGSLRTCGCPGGTEGPFCEIIPSCNDIECDVEANCFYDPVLGIGKCKCYNPEMSFDPISQKCIRTCDLNRRCKNGGQCKKGGSLYTCYCSNGTEGTFCETVPSCYNIDCGPEESCVFDVILGTGNCICNDQKMSFDPNDQKCKRTCNGDTACKNGGKCEKDGSLYTCYCPKGTEGPFCETVPSCYDVECGPEASCDYNASLGKGNCKCDDQEMSFDPNDGKCKRTCDYNRRCKNGGQCEKDGSLYTCYCPKGTEGPFCEIVPSCYNIECGLEASCIYNAILGKGNCKCKDQEMSFDPNNMKCKRTCEDNADCKNGGECQIDGSLHTCNCTKGTEGPFCETIPSCYNIECGLEASCLYDAILEKGNCKCKDQEMSFDPNDLKCKRTCKDNTACKNGGKCKKDGSLDICVCPKGAQGPFCETVPACDNKKCGTDATCVFMFGQGICMCNEKGTSFDRNDLKCKRTCKDNTACKNGGNCEKDGSLYTCRCPKGTEGPFCETVPSCLNIECGLEASCVYNANLEKGNCKCEDQELFFDPNNMKCKNKCNLIHCLNGGKCDLRNGKAVCICKEKFAGDFCEQEIREALPMISTVMK